MPRRGPGGQGYTPPPKVLPAFPGAVRVMPKTRRSGGAGCRPRWKDDELILKWDSYELDHSQVANLLKALQLKMQLRAKLIYFVKSYVGSPNRDVELAEMPTLIGFLQSSVPRRNMGQPLMVALVALLVSGAVFRGVAGQTASAGAQPTSGEGAGGVLSGLNALLKKLQQGGLGSATNSWISSGQKHPVSPSQIGSALGPSIIKPLAQQTGLSEEELTKQLAQVLPGFVSELTPDGRLPTVKELSRIMSRI